MNELTGWCGDMLQRHPCNVHGDYMYVYEPPPRSFIRITVVTIFLKRTRCITSTSLLWMAKWEACGHTRWREWGRPRETGVRIIDTCEIFEPGSYLKQRTANHLTATYNLIYWQPPITCGTSRDETTPGWLHLSHNSTVLCFAVRMFWPTASNRSHT